MKLNLYKEDKKELEELEKEIKKLKLNDELKVNSDLITQLEESLNKLKEKIKYENED